MPMNFRFYLLLAFGAGFVVAACLVMLYVVLPDPIEFENDNPQSTSFMKRYCTKPCDIRWISIDEVPNLFKELVLRKEDPHFYHHNGFDKRAMLDALILNLQDSKFSRGASTVPMQLARNLYLHSEKTLLRKIKELLLTYKIERSLSKRRILELYINVIEYAPNVYGLSNASTFHFNKSPKHLNLLEISQIVSALPTARWTKKLGDTKPVAANAQKLFEHILAVKLPMTPPLVQRNLKNCQGRVNINDSALLEQALKDIYMHYGHMIEDGDGALLTLTDIERVLGTKDYSLVTQIIERMRQGRGAISCEMQLDAQKRFESVSINTVKGQYRHWIPEPASENLRKLMADASSSGHILNIESAYRGKGYQLYLILKMLHRTNYCLNEVARFIELPDRSEHSCFDSVAIDFSSEEFRGEKFSQATAYQWLLKNAQNYDFSLSYDENNTDVIAFEPWHWRFQKVTD